MLYIQYNTKIWPSFSLLFFLQDHNSQCLPLASTVTVDAIGIDELILELTIGTMIVWVGVIVELVVVKESDVDDDAEAAADQDGVPKAVESSTWGEALEQVSTLKVNKNGRACMYLRTGIAGF